MSPLSKSLTCHQGFTLAELLISLAILGVIAIFTIPKILATQQNEKYKATSKEVIAAVAAAYDTYQRTNTLSASTSPKDITPYLNYASVNTTSWLTETGRTCTDTGMYICLNMHSGGILWMEKNASFNGTGPLNAQYFFYDVAPSQALAGGSTVHFFRYYNGRITTSSQISVGTNTSIWTWGASFPDPSWWSW